MIINYQNCDRAPAGTFHSCCKVWNNILQTHYAKTKKRFQIYYKKTTDSGTHCQNASLNRMYGRLSEVVPRREIYTVGIVCLAVEVGPPSMQVFNANLQIPVK